MPSGRRRERLELDLAEAPGVDRGDPLRARPAPGPPGSPELSGRGERGAASGSGCEVGRRVVNDRRASDEGPAAPSLGAIGGRSAAAGRRGARATGLGREIVREPRRRPGRCGRRTRPGRTLAGSVVGPGRPAAGRDLDGRGRRPASAASLDVSTRAAAAGAIGSARRGRPGPGAAALSAALPGRAAAGDPGSCPTGRVVTSPVRTSGKPGPGVAGVADARPRRRGRPDRSSRRRGRPGRSGRRPDRPGARRRPGGPRPGPPGGPIRRRPRTRSGPGRPSAGSARASSPFHEATTAPPAPGRPGIAGANEGGGEGEEPGAGASSAADVRLVVSPHGTSSTIAPTRRTRARPTEAGSPIVPPGTAARPAPIGSIRRGVDRRRATDGTIGGKVAAPPGTVNPRTTGRRAPGQPSGPGKRPKAESHERTQFAVMAYKIDGCGPNFS